MRICLLSALVLLLMLSCFNGGPSGNGDDGDTDADIEPITTGSWYRPPLSVTWQWQLIGTVNTTYDVDIYDVDLFDVSTALIQQLQADGRRVICYFSAGSYEDWRTDAGQFDCGDIGNALDGWPDERWLDIRSESILEIMQNRLNMAVQKNCDGVEPDNMDGYLNDSGFDLTAADQLAYNRGIANLAHERNLSVGLKNDLDQVDDLVDYYDFAVNEECFAYDECSLLATFIDAGKPVLNAEYEDSYVSDPIARSALCTDALNRQFSTLVLPLDLDDSFRFTCQ